MLKSVLQVRALSINTNTLRRSNSDSEDSQLDWDRLTKDLESEVSKITVLRTQSEDIPDNLNLHLNDPDVQIEGSLPTASRTRLF